jgi:hypothetical protein
MSGFPVQLRWSQFVGVLRKLDYKPAKSHRGSGRVFFNPTRTPKLILFHEPVGKKCLCNALMANIGHPQVRNGKYTEQALITSGNDLAGIDRFLPEGSKTYAAGDVVRKLLSPTEDAR